MTRGGMTELDRILVEHLATKVMGWKRIYADLWVDSEHHLHDGTLDLDSWADAGMVWDAARAKGINIELYGQRPYQWRAKQWNDDGTPHHSSRADSGPRAICEAIAKATGWNDSAPCSVPEIDGTPTNIEAK